MTEGGGGGGNIYGILTITPSKHLQKQNKKNSSGHTATSHNIQNVITGKVFLLKLLGFHLQKVSVRNLFYANDRSHDYSSNKLSKIQRNRHHIL